MKDTPYLSIIIPSYNEERNIRLGALENVAHYLYKQKYLWEVLLVDDGSSDESPALIKQFIKDHQKNTKGQFRLLNRPHQGKAAAVTSGMNEAKGKYILFTDLDQATPIHQVELLFTWFEKGYDIVIGSRSNQRKGAPLLRLTMARGFMLLRNIILDLGIYDTQCGFKAFTRKAAFDVFPRLKVFNLQKSIQGSTVTAGFDVELLYIAKLLGYKIAEVPVEWHYQETRHVNPIKDSLQGIFDLLQIRINSIRGVYKEIV